MKQDEKQRQQSKTREQSFLSVLESEFDFAPQVCQRIAGRSKKVLVGGRKRIETRTSESAVAAEKCTAWKSVEAYRDERGGLDARCRAGR